MAANGSHIVATRSGFTVLRIFQIIFALMVLGACIYGELHTHLTSFTLSIFTSIATLVALIYIISASCYPIVYQYWAILALEIFCLILWAVSLALLGNDIAYVSPYVKVSHSSYSYYSSSYYSKYDWSTRALIVICSAMGAGGIELIFFITSLSMFGVALAHHRHAGGH